MPAGPAVDEPEIRADLFAELQALRGQLCDPDGDDPAASLPLSPEDDAVEICAAVYALPGPFREAHRSGLPLLWPWPSDLYLEDLSRRDELLLAAAYLMAAVERLDRAAARIATIHTDVRDLRSRRFRGTLGARLGWGRTSLIDGLRIVEGEAST